MNHITRSQVLNAFNNTAKDSAKGGLFASTPFRNAIR